MRKSVRFLFFCLLVLCGHLYAAGIATSPDKLKVIINEINENTSNNFVELYSPNGINVTNWKLVLNDPGNGVTSTCSFSNNFTAGSYYVLNSSNCPAMAFHPVKNEVFLLDSANKVVHYVSLWQGGAGQSTQSYMDYFDNRDSSVTTNLNTLVTGESNYCALIDGATGLPQWSSNCPPSPGATNEPLITINDVSIFEGNSGTTDAQFVVSLSKAALTNVTVDYATVDGSAIAGSDYQATSGTLTFSPGQTSKTVTVKIFGDKTYEPDETYTVVLSNASSNATVSKAIGYGTIKNDDAPIQGLRCYRTDFNSSAVLTNDWTVSKSSGSFLPTINNQRLRMTEAVNTQATSAMLKKFFPPAKNRYIVVEFDMYSYGGSGADGVAVVLSDASVTPVPGAFGGSLGYAQKCQNGVAGCSSDCTTAGGCPGFAGGWLGIGFDEYHNYANPIEGRYNASGDGGAFTGAVSIRGSDGNTTSKSSLYNYKYLYGTSAGKYMSGAKYRTTIDAFDLNKTMVSVDINRNDGNGFVSLISGFDINSKDDANWVQKAIPEYFRLSLTSSTGGLNNIHEVDNMEVCSVMYEEDQSDIYISNFTASPSSLASVNDLVTFTLSVFNPGPVDTLGNVSVSIPELANWDISSASATLGSFSGTTWIIGTPFTKGTLATLIIKAKMKQCSATKILTATAVYGLDPDVTNNTKSTTLTTTCQPAQAVEKGGDSNSKMFTKVAGLSFDADILSSAPSSISALKLMGDGVQLVDFNATPAAATITKLSDRVRIVGINVNRAAKVAQFEVNGTLIADSFAIKPSGFSVTASPVAVKAGAPFDLSITNSVLGYSGTATISTATYNQTCSTKSEFLTTEPLSVSFTSATRSATGLVSKDVGDVNVSIRDTTWTLIDQPNDCVVGSNSNVYDANGKVGCNIDTNATMKIAPYDINVSRTNTNPMWVYKSLNGLPKLTLNIEANATRPPIGAESQPQFVGNFSNGCFAKDTRVDVGASVYPSTNTLSDVNIYADIAAVSKTSSNISVVLPSTSFAAGKANASVYLNNEKAATDTPEEPLKLTLTSWQSTSDGTVYSAIASSDVIHFMYGKVVMPNAIVDYAPNVTVRAYAEVYAKDVSKLPSGASWVQAPGSAYWWVNALHGSSNDSITNAVIKSGDVLDSSTNVAGFGFGSIAPYVLSGGIAPFSITMTPAQNKDQKVKIHLFVPTYLWQGTKAYDVDPDTDCSQHPCALIDIYGTAPDTSWYGSGDTGNKAIQTVPKGKRAPKVNW